jgi:predicted dinucleotide-binding enzyme
MRIGIVGSDDRAMAIGRVMLNGGHQVTFGDPAAQERARRAAALVGARDETPYSQAMKSDVLLLAVPRQEIDRAVTAVGSGAEAVIVDAVEGERGNGSLSGAQMLAHKLDPHH